MQHLALPFMPFLDESPLMPNRRISNSGLCLLMIAAMLIVGCQRSAPVEEKKKVTGHILPPARVSLTVDFADKRASIDFQMDWTEGMTAFDILKEADRAKSLALVYTGSGETAFVKSIGGTEGGAGGNKWWLFFVNDQMGKIGSGVYKLNANDKVIWRLGDYE